MLDLLEIFLKYTHTHTHTHMHTHATTRTHTNTEKIFYIYKNITVPFSYFYCYFLKKF